MEELFQYKHLIIIKSIITMTLKDILFNVRNKNIPHIDTLLLIIFI